MIEYAKQFILLALHELLADDFLQRMTQRVEQSSDFIESLLIRD
jgi:hypothetical protein